MKKSPEKERRGYSSRQESSRSPDRERRVRIVGKVENSKPKSGCLDREAFNVKLKVNEKSVKFALDTGSEKTVLTEETFKELNVKLEPQSTLLVGADGADLNALGEAQVCIQDKQRSTETTVSVVGGANKNILGAEEICALDLLAVVNSTTIDPSSCVAVGRSGGGVAGSRQGGRDSPVVPGSGGLRKASTTLADRTAVSYADMVDGGVTEGKSLPLRRDFPEDLNPENDDPAYEESQEAGGSLFAGLFG